MKVRGGYYASVAGKIMVLLEVMGSKQRSIYFIQQDICLHYNPTVGLGMLYEEDETFIAKSDEEVFENGWVTGETGILLFSNDRCKIV